MCLKHDRLFKAYPQLKDFTVRLSYIKGNLRGQFNGKEIILNSALSQIQKKKTLIHEIQHYIQSVENFARGGSEDLGLCYAVNDAYSEAIKQPEYKKLKTPDERIDFTFSLAEKRFNVKGIENVAFKAYRNIYGEVEARETSDLMNFNDEVLKYVEPNTSGKVVVNKTEELRKFVDNLQKMGYTEGEIKSLFGGVDNDESRGNKAVARGYGKSEYNGLRAFFSDTNIGTLQTERTFKGTTGSNRRGVSSSLQIINDEAGLNNNSAFSIEENNKFTVSKDLNTSENSVENDDKNGIIKNIPIYKSIGAKAKNYDVLDLQTGEHFHLVEGTYLQNVYVFAGKGSKTVFRKAEKYAEKYGGNPNDWQHVKGFGSINYFGDERRAELHWVQCKDIGKHDFFVKEWLD